MAPNNALPDVEALRALCAAAELGGVGRAAVRLRVSQPAVSKRLHHLEARLGVQLLERSPHGVKLTPAGRRLYDPAKRALEALELVADALHAVARSGGHVRLAASHSAAEAIVAEALGALPEPLSVELVTANSSTVRDMVADGRADLGVAASRPNHTPYPAVREQLLLNDEVVLAVPDSHPWVTRGEVSLQELLRTRVVMRDRNSNSRWTIDAVLRERGLELSSPLVEASTPQAAMREARTRRAPLMLGRRVLHGHGFHELAVRDLVFPRSFVLVLPGIGEPPGEVAALMDHLQGVAGAPA